MAPKPVNKTSGDLPVNKEILKMIPTMMIKIFPISKYPWMLTPLKLGLLS